MPPMPFPVTRNQSIVALEDMLNTTDARQDLLQALSDVKDLVAADQRLGQHLRDKSSGDAKAAVETMLTTIGNAALRHRSDVQITDFVDAGIFHLDHHWFRAGDERFWADDYYGQPAEIMRWSLHEAILLASPDPGNHLPMYVTWVCGSETFEVSVSEVRGLGTEAPVAVAIVISTPTTADPLSYGEAEFVEDHHLFGESRSKGGDPYYHLTPNLDLQPGKRG